MKRPRPLCLICGKPADPIKDRTTDGTHAHYQCLRDTQTRPPGR